MVAVMGVLAVVTVVGIMAFYLAGQSMTEATNTQQQSLSFQVANSGIDVALADIQANGFNPARTHWQETIQDMGSYVVDVTLADDGDYLAIATGKASASTTETIQVKFFYLNLWDVNMGAGESESLGGGSGWNGNASITGPFYIRGDMEWTSSASFNKGPLFLRDGRLILTGSGDVGSASEPIKLYATKGYTGKTENLHASAVSYTVPDIKLPWVDDTYMDTTMDIAKNESIDNKRGDSPTANPATECAGVDPSTYTTVDPSLGRVPAATVPASGSQYYKYLGDGSRAVLGAGQKRLTIGGADFGWVNPLDVTQHDDFAFRNRTLFVEGTVFVDGPVDITSGVTQYVGNGTIVANGPITINGALLPLGYIGNYGYALGLVTPGAVTLNAEMKGAVFCNGTFGLYGTHTTFEGTVLAGKIYGDLPNISITNNPDLKDFLPQSMPGKGATMLIKGAWTRK